jgi:hypothetical protein
MWTVVRFPVIVRDMLLHEPAALRMEGTVSARGASAEKKMRMRLAAIAPSTEEVRVRQVEGVNIAYQLLAVRGWDGVIFSQMLGHPYAAWL